MEPEDEESLEGKVPGEVIKDDAEGEALDEVEEAKDNPVSEPLDVIAVSGRLKGPSRGVIAARIGPLRARKLGARAFICAR